MKYLKLVQNISTYHFGIPDEFQQLTETAQKKMIRSYCILLLKLIQSPDIGLDELLNLMLNIDHDINNALIDNVKELIHSIVTTGVRCLLDTIDAIGRLPAFEENTVKSGTIHIRNSVVGINSLIKIFIYISGIFQGIS